MFEKHKALLLTSAALTLALGQAVWASETTEPAPAAAPVPPAETAPAEPTPMAEAPADPAPMAEAPAEPAPASEAPAPAPTAEAPATPSRAEAARTQMEQRRAEHMAKRERQYEAVRKSAAEIGIDLPETPPWASAGAPGPEQMGRPVPPGARTAMTPDELEAMRIERWEEMRARAAENGVEMPETPPWVAAQERRNEMKERFEKYRQTIEQMSDEQKEAIEALLSTARASMMRDAPPMQPPMSRGMPGYGGPCGYHGGCRGMYNPGMGPQMMSPPMMSPDMPQGMPEMGEDMPQMMPPYPPQPPMSGTQRAPTN